MTLRQRKNLLGHKSGIYALDVLPGDRLISGAGDGWVVEWSLASDGGEDGQLLSKIDAQIFALCYHSASGQIWVGDMNGGIYVIDYEKRELIHKQAHHSRGTYIVHGFEDGVITAGADGRFTIWDVETHTPEESFRISKKHLRAIAFHPNRPVMAIAGGDEHIYFFHTESWKCIHKISKAHERSIFDLAFDPSGEILFSGGMDARLKAWTWSEDKLRKDIPAHRFTINALAISENDNILVTASRDNSVKVWSLEDLALLKVIDSTKKYHHLNSVNALRYSSESQTFISASDDRTIRLWSLSESNE
jgi:WD40 repeat protein